MVKKVAKKAAIKKITEPKVFGDNQWTVRLGKLTPGPGHPEAVERLDYEPGTLFFEHKKGKKGQATHNQVGNP